MGNSSLLLIICLLVSTWLYMGHYKRAARTVWIAFLLTASIIILAKLLFMGCFTDNRYGIRSPSGHAGLSLASYGMLALLMGQALGNFGKAIVNIIALFLITLIAVSRFVLGYHSIGEVLVGLVAGFIGLGVAGKYFFNWNRELLRLNVPLLIVLISGIAYLMHDMRLPAETWVKQLAEQLKLHVDYCAPESQPGSTSRDNSAS